MALKAGVPGAPAEALFKSGQPYDPALADQAVRFRRVVFDSRFWELAAVVLRFWADAVRRAALPNKELSASALKRLNASRLRDMFVELGATFIKVGQFLSVRRDILPLEVAEELTTLQDRVPAFGIDLVRQTVVADLGHAPEEIFEYFEPTPLASASIGQVHRARLPDGSWVVVKVQRPDLGEMFYRDLGYLRLWARAAMRLGMAARARNWLELSDEFGRTLFSEINYIEEGRNADRLRRSLRNEPRVRVPRVCWKYTGRRVLTLEYLPGIKIDNVAELSARGFDLRQLGNLLIECYLHQLLFSGFFHADPHPGNLAVDDDGCLILYDFGMMGELSAAQRRAVTGCIASVVARDPDNVVKYLGDLGVVREDARKEPVSRTLTPFIEYYAGRDILDLDFSDLERDVDKVIEDQALRLPPTLAYLLRCGTSLEGIARTLKPNFSFVAAAKPVLRRWALDLGGADGSLIIRELIAAARRPTARGKVSAGDHSLPREGNGKGGVGEPTPSGGSTPVGAPAPGRDAPGDRELDRSSIGVTSWAIAGIVSLFVAAVAFAALAVSQDPEYRGPGLLLLAADGAAIVLIFWRLKGQAGKEPPPE